VLAVFGNDLPKQVRRGDDAAAHMTTRARR